MRSRKHEGKWKEHDNFNPRSLARLPRLLARLALQTRHIRRRGVIIRGEYPFYLSALTFYLFVQPDQPSDRAVPPLPGTDEAETESCRFV